MAPVKAAVELKGREQYRATRVVRGSRCRSSQALWVAFWVRGQPEGGRPKVHPTPLRVTCRHKHITQGEEQQVVVPQPQPPLSREAWEEVVWDLRPNSPLSSWWEKGTRVRGVRYRLTQMCTWRWTAVSRQGKGV